jgi:hypothetical protein
MSEMAQQKEHNLLLMFLKFKFGPLLASGLSIFRWYECMHATLLHAHSYMPVIRVTCTQDPCTCAARRAAFTRKQRFLQCTVRNIQKLRKKTQLSFLAIRDTRKCFKLKISSYNSRYP